VLEECQRFLDGSFYCRVPQKTPKEVTYCHGLLRRSRNGTKHKPDGIAVFVGFRAGNACYGNCDVGRGQLKGTIAIASATSAHTAPLCFRSSIGTPRTVFFISFV
jgi:hypothetical protein